MRHEGGHGGAIREVEVTHVRPAARRMGDDVGHRRAGRRVPDGERDRSAGGGEGAGRLHAES